MRTFGADIYAGEREVLVRYFEASDDAEAREIARQDVVSLGHDRAEVWRGDVFGHASYIDTVKAE